jgi:hypothetical protein
MSLAAAQTRIASFANRLVAELTREGFAGEWTQGGAQTTLLDILVREFAPLPATENLPALLGRLCAWTVTLDEVKADERTAREEVIRAIIHQAVNFSTLLAGFKPNSKRAGTWSKGAMSHLGHASTLRAGAKRDEKLARCIERARANG